MKKTITLVIALALICTCFVGCGTNQDVESLISDIGTIVSDVNSQLESNNDLNSDNVFYNPNNNTYDVNAISIKPYKVYWQNGSLVAECFVINGFAHNVYNINVKNITFSNTEGQIASASFGGLNNLTLAPYTNVVWTFTFEADCISAPNADLSRLICNASTSNSY